MITQLVLRVALATLPQNPPDQVDVQVSAPNDQGQEETVLAVDPRDRRHLIGGAIDERGTKWNCAFYASMDGGLSWHEFRYPQGPTDTIADPCAAFGPSGETYFGVMSVDDTIYVGRSPDGGLSVPSWVPVEPHEKFVTNDRPNFAVDLGPGPRAGTLYVTWGRVEQLTGLLTICISSSTDGGQTWRPRVRLSDSKSCAAAYPAIGPSGEVYVAFYDFTDATIKFDVSLDGGATWGADVEIAKAHSFEMIIPNAKYRPNAAPLMDVDRSDGRFKGTIYVSWTDLDSSGGTDVLMAKSKSRGASWSSPVPVHEVTTNSQFFPWVDADVNGNVNFGFYDRRNDPNDARLDYYVSRSSNGGASFWPNVKVSDKSFDPNAYADGDFMGDFAAIAASDRTVHALWADGRNGTNDIFTSRVQLDLYTDLDEIPASTGATFKLTLNPGPRYRAADYRILGSLSGTVPGVDFPNANLPLNPDLFLLETIALADGGLLPGFLGKLDATGSASGTASTGGPLDPSLIGLGIDFAAIVSVGGVVQWASDPAHLVIIP